MVELTVVGNGSSVGDSRASGAARLPELPPLLGLDGLLGVRVRPRVAVEEDVLLERGVLVHALELGHGDDGLLALSCGAGPRALNIVVGRHCCRIKECCLSYVLLYPVTLGTEKAVRAT